MVNGLVSTSTEPETSSRVESLFAANQGQLGRFLVQMVRDRALAEDLLQDTFEDAYKARHRLEGVANPDAWLFGIARHRALASLRRTRRMRRAIERLGERRESGPESPACVEVMDVLDRVLTADDRSLVVLRYVHEFDASTLAELTGRSPAAIRKRLERACAALSREIPR